MVFCEYLTAWAPFPSYKFKWSLVSLCLIKNNLRRGHNIPSEACKYDMSNDVCWDWDSPNKHVSHIRRFSFQRVPYSNVLCVYIYMRILISRSHGAPTLISSQRTNISLLPIENCAKLFSSNPSMLLEHACSHSLQPKLQTLQPPKQAMERSSPQVPQVVAAVSTGECLHNTTLWGNAEFLKESKEIKSISFFLSPPLSVNLSWCKPVLKRDYETGNALSSKHLWSLKKSNNYDR